MKRLRTIKWLFLTLLLVCASNVAAHDFEVYGIYYNITDSTNLTVEVTYKGDSYYDYWEYGGNIAIPESVTYNGVSYRVTSIGERAFSGCPGLTNIVIPNSVTSIGESAFNGCDGLTNIVIPNSVTSIGDMAFVGCSGLTSIEIPNSVTSIVEYAFHNCTGLTSIEIPASVTSIGRNAFSGCSGLTSIIVDDGNTVYDSREGCNAIIKTANDSLIAGCQNTVIPNSVTSIGNRAFYNCSGLTSIEIPNSVTGIGDYAFHNCIGLTNIEIPGSVTSIGKHAFFRCFGLTSIEIPNSVTSIGDGVFYNCRLTKIVSNISAEDLFVIDSYVFHNVDNTAVTLYVPIGAKETYATTAGWSSYANIVEITTVVDITSAGYATLYSNGARVIPAGVKAYYISGIRGEYATLTEIAGVIPANTGVILKGDEGSYLFEATDVAASAITGNYLRGSVEDTYVSCRGNESYYVLSVVNGVVGMYGVEITDGMFKNNAGKAYMSVTTLAVGDGTADTSDPATQLSTGYRFEFIGATGIEDIETENIVPVYYDLSGRRVENPAKGLYIVNGKKELVK